MKKNCLQAGFTLLAGALAIISLVQLSDQAHARPQYFKSFAAKYPDFKVDASAKCAYCHKGPDKKTRNDYGVAVGTALGAKNVKDNDAIGAARARNSGTTGTASLEPNPLRSPAARAEPGTGAWGAHPAPARGGCSYGVVLVDEHTGATGPRWVGLP